MGLYDLVYEKRRRKRGAAAKLSARSFGKWLFPSKALGSRRYAIRPSPRGRCTIIHRYYRNFPFCGSLFFHVLRGKGLAGRSLLDSSLFQETLQHNDNAIDFGRPNSTGCVYMSIATYLHQLHIHGCVVGLYPCVGILSVRNFLKFDLGHEMLSWFYAKSVPWFVCQPQ